MLLPGGPAAHPEGDFVLTPGAASAISGRLAAAAVGAQTQRAQGQRTSDVISAPNRAESGTRAPSARTRGCGEAAVAVWAAWPSRQQPSAVLCPMWVPEQKNTTWRWLTAPPAGHGEWPDLTTGRRAAGRTPESSAAGPAAVAAGLCQGAGQSPQDPGLLPGHLRSHPHASPPSPVIWNIEELRASFWHGQHGWRQEARTLSFMGTSQTADDRHMNLSSLLISI
ncbi:uncharacterized protein LOC144176060 [Haemaphysalis longicornis]